jgi:hypothetical protein
MPSLSEVWQNLVATMSEDYYAYKTTCNVQSCASHILSQRDFSSSQLTSIAGPEVRLQVFVSATRVERQVLLLALNHMVQRLLIEAISHSRPWNAMG